VPVGELPVVADYGWNRWASASTPGAVLLWWLAIGMLGWLAWPLTFVVFRGLRDRGYVLSRSVALIVVGYLVWLPSSLHWLKNGLLLTYGAIGVLTLISGLLLLRYRAEMGAFVRNRWRVILIGEVIFALAYLAFVAIRILNPDLWQPWQGGEKLMDIAYFNACLRSAFFPPYDPYFADGYLNYYYYGQFLMSIPTRLTGIGATVAYNLAVPTLFSLTVCNAFSIGYSLAGKILSRSANRRERAGFGISHGLLAAVCVTVFGNLASATQVVERLGWVSQSEFTSQIPGLAAWVRAISGAREILFHGTQFPGFNYWDPSRVVGYTINEFPYWSFLFADLHPHMMNIPLTLLVIALALNWLLYRRAPARADLPIAAQHVLPDSELALFRHSFRYVWLHLDWGEVLGWVVWPIALGALWATNSWDWPAYAGLSGLVLLIAWVRVRHRQGIVPALLAGVSLAAGSLGLYLPFLQHYAAIHVGFGWSLSRGHTLPGEFLEVWGFVLFLAISLLLILIVQQRSRSLTLRLLRLAGRHATRLHRVERWCRLLVHNRQGGRVSLAVTSILLIATIFLAWKGYWVLVWMVPLLGLAAALLTQPEMTRERRFVLALVFTSFLLLVGVELFYLKDHLAGDQTGWWRMNTLFKFYLQVWIMMGVAVGASLPDIWQAVERWRWGWRAAWTAVLGVLLVAVSLFAMLGTPARVFDRFPGERPRTGTLDGIAFMTVGTYTWPDETHPIHLQDDYDAIRWLQDNVQGTPVLAEAPVGYYREFGGRVSSYTGLPTAYNDQHQREQRYGWQTARRSHVVGEFFTTPDEQRTIEIARELAIEYVYIGPLERTQYPSAADKFDHLAFSKLMSIVYQNGQVTIYRVDQ
jgi:YYY domain-containing protein